MQNQKMCKNIVCGFFNFNKIIISALCLCFFVSCTNYVVDEKKYKNIKKDLNWVVNSVNALGEYDRKILDNISSLKGEVTNLKEESSVNSERVKIIHEKVQNIEKQFNYKNWVEITAVINKYEKVYNAVSVIFNIWVDFIIFVISLIFIVIHHREIFTLPIIFEKLNTSCFGASFFALIINMFVFMFY